MAINATDLNPFALSSRTSIAEILYAIFVPQLFHLQNVKVDRLEKE